MKNHLVSFALWSFILLLGACAKNKHEVEISGEFKNLETAEFYVYNQIGPQSQIDTIKIEGGKFSYARKITEPCVLTIQYPNFLRTTFVAEPGDRVKIKADAAHLLKADISGTEANERLTKFRLDNLNKSGNDWQLAAKQYIRDNAGSLDALAVFRDAIEQAAYPDGRSYGPLLSLMLRKQPGNYAVKKTVWMWKDYLKNTRGKMLPSIALKDLDGKTFSTSLCKEKPLILFFWASWLPGNGLYMSAVNKLWRAYGQKVQIIGICLDPDIKEAVRVCKEDTVKYPVVCDGNAFESAIAQKLGIRYAPGNIVVNRSGRIVARDMDINELQEKLPGLLRL